MTEFDNYLSRLRREKEQAELDAAMPKEVDPRQRSVDILKKALPLLVEYARSEALPAVVPTRNPFRKYRQTAAWVVRSYMSDRGNDYFAIKGGQESSLNVKALTEDGLYGPVTPIAGEPPTLRYWGRPGPINFGQMSGIIRINYRDVQEWQLMEQHISGILDKVGIEFTAD